MCIKYALQNSHDSHSATPDPTNTEAMALARLCFLSFLFSDPHIEID
jgi:hypothetical protein